jgi:phosphatidate cytidylyltransferase
MSSEEVNKASKFKGFFVRIISALILLPIAVGSIWYGGAAFQVLLVVGGYLMMREWLALTKIEPKGFGDIYAMGFSLLSIYCFYIYFNSLEGLPVDFFASIFALFVLSFAAIYKFENSKAHAIKWLILGILYVGLPLGSLYWLHLVAGYKWVLWLFLIVWGTDIGGYLFGKFIGGPKLAPKISPKKTWAGLFGGVILAVCFSYLALLYLNMVPLPPFPYAALVLPLIAQMGDIGESHIKRRFNVKDSSNLIPGHGGILDRVDGLVFVAPVVAIGFAALYLDSF